MKKIRKSNNREFHLEFNNGKEAVVRIPTSLAGPPHLTTASEVATFLRRLHLPLPCVLAWNLRAESSEVASTLPFIKALAKTLRPLANLQFKYHSSIYYKEDVPSDMTGYHDFLLDAALSDLHISPFVIGPSVCSAFWEAEWATTSIDRGPCECSRMSAVDSLQAEILWLEGWFAKPSLDDHYLCILPTQQVEDHLRKLDHYKTILPYITPTDGVFNSDRLWHPNLQLEDVYFKTTNSGVEITSLTSWTGAVIGPAFLNVHVPPFLFNPYDPGLVGDPNEQPKPLHDGMNEDEFRNAMHLNKNAAMYKAFEVETFPDIIGLMIRQHAAATAFRSMGSTWKTWLIPARYAYSQVITDVKLIYVLLASCRYYWTIL
ncbi:hypothetical protein EUX98_g5840 [Antrodiella citrinella]|uniref:Aminoglycoside phosphotransferase domain-containing protein n=1 Tax=Antrodiella citrinella TaxID=2447956 RepID=A0A4V3XI98_9APHY|nr:hypothetical protein EUX98_g5840 [Antrodiella citrinella]